MSELFREDLTPYMIAHVEAEPSCDVRRVASRDETRQRCPSAYFPRFGGHIALCWESEADRRRVIGG